MKRPANLGARPKPLPGPATSRGPLLIEHLSEFEGWAVLDEAGRQLNPFLRTAPGLAYYLSRQRLASRITNLNLLSARLQEIAKSNPLR